LIGVFDSGVGGLSVLTEIRADLPQADLLYVADRARAPYGPRTLDEVEAIALEVTKWLVDRGSSCVVVACNTASAAALESIRGRFPEIPIVGMEPAVKPAALASKSGRVAVLATAATFQGRLFESVVSRFAAGVEVTTGACPEWVQLVEEGEVEGLRAETLVGEVTRPIEDRGVDVVVLACTHFSFLSPVIESLSSLTVIDPARAVAAQTRRVAPNQNGRGELVLAASGDAAEFARLTGALASITAPVIRFAP
jgi:glutamate racemase